MSERASLEQMILELLKSNRDVKIHKSPDGMFTITIGNFAVSCRSLSAALAAVVPRQVSK